MSSPQAPKSASVAKAAGDSTPPLAAKDPATSPAPHRPPAANPLWARSLLDSVVAESVDPSYAKAARDQPQSPAQLLSRLRTGVVTVVAAAALSAVMVITFVQARVGKDPVEQTRSALEQEIGRRQQTTSQLQARVQQLRYQVAAASGEIPAAEGFTAQERMLAQVGLTAVRCSGVQISIVDLLAASADAHSPRQQQGYAQQRLNDRDMQALANGLWAQHGQAIAINGHRLVATSAIRKAGQAILVDYQPILSPYVVQVCGDGQQLTQAVRLGQVGAPLQQLAQLGSITVSVTVHADMVLAAAKPKLRYISADGAHNPAPVGQGVEGN